MSPLKFFIDRLWEPKEGVPTPIAVLGVMIALVAAIVWGLGLSFQVKVVFGIIAVVWVCWFFKLGPTGVSKEPAPSAPRTPMAPSTAASPSRIGSDASGSTGAGGDADGAGAGE